jgi:hypothetical protein
MSGRGLRGNGTASPFENDMLHYTIAGSCKTC